MRQVFALCGITLSIKRWAEYNKKCYDSQNIPRETHVVSVLAPYNIDITGNIQNEMYPQSEDDYYDDGLVR